MPDIFVSARQSFMRTSNL